MTDMQTIQQEGVTNTRNVSLAPKSRDFFDDFTSSGYSSRSKYEMIVSREECSPIRRLVTICYRRMAMSRTMMTFESTESRLADRRMRFTRTYLYSNEY